jgi:Tfp pilus assembly protein PilO
MTQTALAEIGNFTMQTIKDAALITAIVFAILANLLIAGLAFALLSGVQI